MKTHRIENLVRARIYSGIVLRAMDRAFRAVDLVRAEYPTWSGEVYLANAHTIGEPDLDEVPEIRVVLWEGRQPVDDLLLSAGESVAGMRESIRAKVKALAVLEPEPALANA